MGGNSWLDVVKKALIRSPTKHTKTLKARMREDEEYDDELPADKKSSKRRWIFKKTTLHETTTIRHDESTTLSTSQSQSQSYTLATKPITPAEVIRLSFLIQNAALVIQTSFRRYLARRALEALKGVVKLQALVRGHNVRRRTKMTLINCMQTLLRVQARLYDQHTKLSNEGSFQLDSHLAPLPDKKVASISPQFRRWERSPNQQQRLSPHPSSSPRMRRYEQSPPITPSSATHRCSQREERRSFSSSPQTSLRGSGSPSYMSATVSAMARIRPQSTPRQRRISTTTTTTTTTTEGDKKKTCARKRLSFSGVGVGDSDSELDCNLTRSPIYTMERRRLSMSAS